MKSDYHNQDMDPERHQFQNDGLTLSYLDAGGIGKPLIALHAHWMAATTYTPLAAALEPAWRVIALDQRGHGYSGHPATYTRQDYLRDLEALYDHLKITEAVLLGNSLGGVNAFQFAARRPDRVKAIIIEDIGVVIEGDLSFVLTWCGLAASRDVLAQRIGPRFQPYLEDSFREVPGGWTLAFDPADMVLSQRHINGDHWEDWLASNCPALLIRGRDSRVTSAAHMEEMAARRAHSSLVTLDGGHVVHFDNPGRFATTVRAFLEGL